ncbi:OpgC family protein [Falsirhodobacter xinxiangensis]|uniref:OpgC family protein n=1 Tax=Falsirhodobacter xinxiangensis TaxID=2530049 RepID=UPI0010AB1375|nr:OpgC domain-containing protein [Rhodobacter xinxiangensis]
MHETTGGRDPRLDVLRGLALVMIYINHVPGTLWEAFTSRNYGFSDAAEGFVMMAGVAAGLAYSSGFLRGDAVPTARRIWRRGWTLYMVHILLTVIAVAVAAAFYKLGAPQLSNENLTHVIFDDPMGFMLGVALLTHQLGYANILPMYAALLFLAPAFLVLAVHRPKLLLAGSILLWAFAGQTRFNLPNYPMPGGWFFNPFAWQLLFVIGLLTGVAMKQGRRLVPATPALVWLSGSVLVIVLIWAKFEPVADVLNAGRLALAKLGFPYWVTEFEKSIVSVLRLVHFLALAYFLSALPIVRRICARPELAPLAVMGRNGLPVFALGTALCYAAQGVMDMRPNTPVLEATLIWGGVALQWLFAVLRDRWRFSKARTPVGVPATP